MRAISLISCDLGTPLRQTAGTNPCSLVVMSGMRQILLLGALALLAAGCTTSEVAETSEEQSASPTTEAVATTTSTSTPPPSSSTVAATTTTSAPSGPVIGDPEFVGVWPYRTIEDVLAAAVDGIDVDRLGLIARFMDEVVGWTEFELTEIYDGTDQMRYDYAGPRGKFHVGTRIVGWSPAGNAVAAVRYASSLDRFEDWGPVVNVAESDNGWSVIVSAAPISELVSLPDVTGPYAQVSYGEWDSELVNIGPEGAAITLPDEPTVPGVLSIWYLHAGGVVTGFSILALPPGPFAAG